MILRTGYGSVHGHDRERLGIEHPSDIADRDLRLERPG